MKDTPAHHKNPLSNDLYRILACPVDKSDLHYTNDQQGLRCTTCGYVYPIKDGIPILLPPDMQEKNSH